MRIAFVPFAYKFGFESPTNGLSVPFMLGELFELSDGTVRIERLYDAPEDQQDGTGVKKLSRTFVIDVYGNTTWRPAGTAGPWECGRRTSLGVLYSPYGGDVTKNSYLVLVVTL